VINTRIDRIMCIWLEGKEVTDCKNVRCEKFKKNISVQLFECIVHLPSGTHVSGYGNWQSRGTRATQCLGV
jgi:hypothetical protein